MTEETITAQSRLNAAIEAEEMNLIAVLRPRLSIDGNLWCFLYGDNLQEGVAGFGPTPYAAALDFRRNWLSQRATVAAGPEAAKTAPSTEIHA